MIQKPKSLRMNAVDAIATLRALLGLTSEYSDRMSGRGANQALVELCQKRIDSLILAEAGQRVALRDQTTETLKVNEVNAAASMLATQMHKAIRRAHPGDKVTQGEFIVTPKSGNYLLKDTFAALQRLIKAIENHPDKAAAARIQEKDKALLEEMYEKLLDADTSQENRKNDRRAGTAAKNALLADVIDSIDTIMAIVDIEFALEPEIRKRFTSAVRTKGKKAAEPKREEKVAASA